MGRPPGRNRLSDSGWIVPESRFAGHERGCGAPSGVHAGGRCERWVARALCLQQGRSAWQA